MSNTKLLDRMRSFNNSQSKIAEKTYFRLLDKLCDAHQSYEFVLPIRQSIGDWGKLLALADSLSSQKYEDYKTHFVANQFSLLIRKYPAAKVQGLDPKANAIKKFMTGEHRCKRTNQKFRCFVNRSPRESLLQRMRDFVQYVLGPCPSDEDIAREAGFGPGASVGVAVATNFSRKLLANSWSVTPGAFDFGYNVAMSNPSLSEILFGGDGQGHYCVDLRAAREAYVSKATVVKHNKIVFVPKTASIMRTIAVEPLLNGYAQKGVDLIMRKRLRRIGIDLSSQRVNQLYALFGSEDWEKENGFCTLDLENASNSMSTELVRAVLPPDWFSLLDRLRSKQGVLNGRSLTYEMFCSMGNGFCFPLETLLFSAICHASGAGKPRLDYMVYGDDIVVRRHVVDLLTENLDYCGFRLNHGKTHVSGPFRESCGEDYFGGIAVRPFTLDFEFKNLVDIIKFLNLTQRNELTKLFFEGIDYATFDVPPDLRFVRPHEGNADTAVTVEFDSFISSPFAKWNPSLQSWCWYELSSEPCRDDWYKRQRQGQIALVYAALAGCKSAMPFAFRRKTKTKIRRYPSNIGRLYPASLNSGARPHVRVPPDGR